MDTKKTVTLQLGPETLRFLNELMDKMRKELPGMPVTLTSVLQMCARRGMPELKTAYKLSSAVPQSVLE